MFIDPQLSTNQNNQPKTPGNKIVVILASIMAIVIIGALLLYIITIENKKNNNTRVISTASSTKTTVGLPESETADNNLVNNPLIGNNKTSAENIFFADYYKLEPISFDSSQIDYSLPLNVKIDVSNYFDISRKINLDSVVNDFNQNGFATINNPFGAKVTNLYSAYDELRKKQIPILVTNDLLLYYYQNTLKDAYKAVEESSFYNDLWVINSSLFKIANERYQRRAQNSSSTVVDFVLEGERLEVAFFATALELLKPQVDQISTDNFSDIKFNFSEAPKYAFDLPLYLQTDVNKEISLIRLHVAEDKSPVMLYSRNYQDFIVPDEYKANAKLNNFFLASKWLNSVFPLFYKNLDCPNCLLDKEDWTVNFIGANLIAKDFADNQEIKNNWAKIYKLKSFFSGLRSGLTYLYYDKTAEDLYGDDYQIDKIFAPDQYVANTQKLQEKLFSYNFSGIEGGQEKNDKSLRPYLGMNFLSDSYWPNEYVFDHLLYPHVTSHYVSKPTQSINTYCNQGRSSYRCRGFGMDIINLITPLAGINKYFTDNTSYQGYDVQIQGLRDELLQFDNNAWHSSNFWSYLDTVKIATIDYSKYPVYMRNNSWKQKDVLTFLGGWLNLQLPAEKTIFSEDIIKQKYITDYDYVEPNLSFINSLQANVRMLQQMFLALDATREKDIAYLKLEKLYNDLNNMRSIINKQFNNELLDVKDNIYISNIIDQSILLENNKKITFNFKTGISNLHSIGSINDFKLLGLVYSRNGKKYLAFGPVFNFQENLK